MFSLQTLNLLLPSSEKLWEAGSAQTWQRTRKPHGKERRNSSDFSAEEEARPLFTAVITHLYNKLEPIDDVSQFANVACIYALFHQHWDTIRRFQGPFSTSNSTQQDKSIRDNTRAPYPAAIPAITLWRNKACDYLDVLHWEALGSSAKAGGLEGPIFLELHLARLLLLTPMKELLTLAEHRAFSKGFLQLPHNVEWHRTDPTSCRKTISTWAHRDRYKARLAVVHAGATFWHVRRYATDSFIQAFTVYLAAIVLYYFARSSVAEQIRSDPSSTSPRATTRLRSEAGKRTAFENGTGTFDNESELSHSVDNTTNTPPGSEILRRSNKQRMPAHFYIDRPVDDELVQYFVRNGEGSIRLCAEAVDNLCSVEGAKQMLVEAGALLDSGNVVWPIARKYAMVLRGVLGEEGEVATV